MISLNKPRSEEKSDATFLRRRFAIFDKLTRATRLVERSHRGGRKCDPIITILKAGLPDFLTFSKSFYLS